MKCLLTRVFLMIAAVTMVGCAAMRKDKPLNYQTIKAGPNRDSARAAKENEVGLRKLEAGNLADAEHFFQQALIADVTYGPAHNHLGQIYFQQGQMYLAAWEFEYAIKLMNDR